MKDLPISIQTFEEVRKNNKIYVDKTELIHKMVNGGKYYFLARPRRFGKSLLLTTLKSYFEGRNDLFKGLFIYDKTDEWNMHPVIHIDYSLVSYNDGKDIFQESLLSHLRQLARLHGIQLKEKVISNAFTELVISLYEKHGKVVVLVDEYDKAMVDVLGNKTNFEENRNILRSLYGAFKALDQYIRFVMLTGVSRFAKVNVFSGLNNLDDISMSQDYSEIVGFTEKELHHYFSSHLEAVRKKFGTDEATFLAAVKNKYNGFSWDGKTKLYNPFSLFKFLNDRQFGNYWFSSGTPNFLVDLIMRQKTLPENLEEVKVSDLIGSTEKIDNLPLLPILFQTGYLTIKKVSLDGFDRRFYLGYPNEEVRNSFILYLAGAFIGKDQYEVQPEALELRDALLEERPQDFIKSLQSFLADIPSRLHIPKEAYYHSLVYMMLRLIGVHLLLEKETDKGRIDALLELYDKVYIIEFKFATNSRVKNVKTLSQQAIKQIEKQKYYEPYLHSEKKIILFGIGYLEKELDGKVKILNDKK